MCWDDVGEQEETVYLAFNYLFVSFCPAQPLSSCVMSCSCVPVLVLGFVKVLAVPLCTAVQKKFGQEGGEAMRINSVLISTAFRLDNMLDCTILISTQT